ncbi:MAG TPA: fused MFS/spermidine synthase [Gemmatimonadaceae bacterium]|nr:fused MFS/spermidine synthase [Gemmatimonadaceae bacterium]
MQYLLYVVFVLSGAAGLVYESIWSRYLGLFVGHSAYAQVIVLTIFLGGMSLGAWGAGRRSERLARPLIAYAFLELAIGAIGLVFHDVFVWTTAWAYDSVFPALAGRPVLLDVVKWGLAGLLILPQSVLLGTTFPLMSAGVLRLVRRAPGRVLSMLYFANSLGAAAGVLVAGFWLIRVAGLPGTLLAAAALNCVVFLVTWIAVGVRAAWMAEEPEAAAAQAAPLAPPAAPAYPMPLSSDALWRLLLAVTFGTAVASFVYEISWIRMLSLVLGSATHSFELMLSAFILGLALGALWIHRRVDALGDPVRALGIVQWVMGALAMMSLPFYLFSFQLTHWLLTALTQTDTAYTIFSIVRYAFCLLVMLPATFCAGMTLPLITKLLLDAGRGERAVGAVYAVNTLGSIVGVILAGLVLMPLLGLKALLITGAVLDMGLGVWVLARRRHTTARGPRLVAVATAGLVVITLASALGNQFDLTLLASGVFRFGAIPDPSTRTIVYYHDGRTATVAVGRGTRDHSLFISTNGKPDASLDTAWVRYDSLAPRRYLGGDISTQVLLPLITLAFQPRAQVAAVIGQGSGMTSHLLLGSPYLRTLTTIEIEPSMIEGSKWFRPANSRVFDDPRSHFAIDDAKSFFAASPAAYDIIVSEPSNPWVSGVSGLFTTQFYARVKRHLSADGVFGQWLHLYEIDDALVLSVIEAIHRNFRSYEVYMTSNLDILIIASDRPALPAPDWSVFDYPMIARDLRPAIRFTPRALDAAHIGGREVFGPLFFTRQGANSDYEPILDLGTERTRFLHTSADGIADLNFDNFDFVSALRRRRVPFGTETLAPVPSIPRQRALAIGAVLHARRVATLEDTLSGTGVLEALARRTRVENGIASGRPPADWRAWLADAFAVSADLHGGTAGVIDSAFYREVFAYLGAQRAPAGARQAFAFQRALYSYDFPAAAALADSLAPAAIAGATWYPVDDLREGGAVAKLALGDIHEAHAFWKALEPRAVRKTDAVRSLLMGAYMIQADQARKGAAQPPVQP